MGQTEPTPAAPARTGWASLGELNRYQWFVFVICCLAWDLDCMDQQLFILARDPAVMNLTGAASLTDDVKFTGTITTSVFMVGWAFGGIAFGILGDRLGRVKTLMWTIFLYALFTGLSAFSLSKWDFMAYRLLTGMGVGGAFAASVVLLAESVPERPRPFILGLFQASSVLGNCGAALISMYLGSLEGSGVFSGDFWKPWRIMFVIGIVPGVLLVLVQTFLKEPERWLAQRAAQDETGQTPWRKFFGTLTDLLTAPKWGKHVLLGLILTGVGVVGLWGIGFFATTLVVKPLETEFKAMGYAGTELKGLVTYWRGITSLVQNFGAFLGIFAFSWVTGIFGRKPTFAVFLVLAAVVTAGTFMFLRTRQEIFWMVPLMGASQLALFGGYAIYLPELFPTKYRSTGTSFCYNAGRLVAAIGPFFLGVLTSTVFTEAHGYGTEGFRYAGATMCCVFLIGLLALPFLPETKGHPLPE
ncbi:MAG: MFS transporter [Gemmataceae bacterium]